MKSFVRSARVCNVLITAVLLIAGILTYLFSTPGESCCQEGKSSDCEPYSIHPVKVSVKPWLGQHQVFGIFKIPLRYRSGRTYSGMLTVQSFTNEFLPDSQPQTQLIDDVVAEPGYYLVRGYVPTRIALWFLMTGRFRQLRSPCEWTLELIKRSP